MILSKIENQLHSDAPAEQIAAFDEIRTLCDAWAMSAVSAMRKSPNPFLIAERLPILGTSCIAPLRTILASDQDPEMQVLASMALLKLGDPVGVGKLLAEVRNVGRYASLAVAFLSPYSSAEVVNTIYEGLERLDQNQVDLVVAYILALKKLGVEIHRKVIDRFTGLETPWQIRTLFN